MLPTMDSPNGAAQRESLFKFMDTDSDAIITLAEAKVGILELVKGVKVMDLDPAPVVEKAFKSIRIVQEALQNGATSVWLIKDPHGADDLAVRKEDFVWLLHDLKYFFELYAIFQESDDGMTDDEVITEKEFMKAGVRIEAWGGKPLPNKKAAFDELDHNSSGTVDIDEFIKWALRNQLNRDAALFARRHKRPLKRSTVNWAVVSRLLPAFRDDESKRQRSLLFRKFDHDGDGVIGFAEAEKGVLSLLEGITVLDMDPRPSIHAAFEAARPVHQMHSKFCITINGEWVVERNEFRLLLALLRFYFEIYAWFQQCDDDIDDDEMISKTEFLRSVKQLELLGAEIGNPHKAWATLDSDGSGKADFTEFLSWALARRMDDTSDDDYDDFRPPMADAMLM